MRTDVAKDPVALRSLKRQEQESDDVSPYKRQCTTRESARKANLSQTNPPAPPSDRCSAGTSEDPNASYVVEKVLSHRKQGRQVFYRVRWEPPFNAREFDKEIKEKDFDRPAVRELPPLLVEYWKHLPVPARPVAYRSL